MAQRIDAALKQKLLSSDFRPAITLWNRLEGRPRTADFSRSLRMEIRDPLWMLTRQWQFGEFKGEDTGSAVKARVQLNTTRIDRYAVKSANREGLGGQFTPAVPYDADLPLETMVEREILWEEGPDRRSAQLSLRSRMGRHWMRLLNEAGLGTQSVRSAVLGRFGFEDILDVPQADAPGQLEAAHVQSDAAAWQSLQALKGRLPDGRRLLLAIENGDFSTWVDSQFEPGRTQGLKSLAQDFRNWFYRLYSQPKTGIEDAWAPAYLEYQFAVSAAEDGQGAEHATLVAEQYHGGRVDWYGFDVDPRASLDALVEGPSPPNGFAVHAPRAFLPTPVEFTGMPNVRLWEFEDRRTDFGSIRAGTADVPLLLLAQFGLVYGNDWTVIPYNLEVGTLADIKGVIMTDVFGVRTLIRAAGRGQRMDWQRWSMYNLSLLGGGDGTDERLFVPPSLAKAQEGEPVETVILARDEMTNLVWAVEARIPGVSGDGVDGFETATALSDFFAQRAPTTETPGEGNGAPFRYLLGSSVPENWIPFVPRHKPDSNRQIRLQRASMPRLNDAIADSRIEPRGTILRTGLDGPALNGQPHVRQPYFLHEEEVPRAGVIVTRGFQRARWFDGKVFTWMGRKKETGRGESSSGLVFDQIEPSEPDR